jgi:hypothetical protein
MRTTQDDYYCHGCHFTRLHCLGRRKSDLEYHGHEIWVRIVCKECGREQWLHMTFSEYDLFLKEVK